MELAKITILTMILKIKNKQRTVVLFVVAEVAALAGCFAASPGSFVALLLVLDELLLLLADAATLFDEGFFGFFASSARMACSSAYSARNTFSSSIQSFKTLLGTPSFLLILRTDASMVRTSSSALIFKSKSYGGG